MLRGDVMLQTATKLVSFMILAFSIYILFAGHNNPGGGFIGGLMTSAAILLLFLAFGLEKMRKAVPIDFIQLTAVGLLLALLTGLGALVFGEPFLTHTFGYFNLPLFGEHTELATATIFDLGVYFTVVGVTMTIILTIGEDR